MTERELTQRYLSDTRAIHDMRDNGSIPAWQHDELINNIDARFFNEIDNFIPAVTLERIKQYSAAA